MPADDNRRLFPQNWSSGVSRSWLVLPRKKGLEMHLEMGLMAGDAAVAAPVNGGSGMTG